MVGIYLVERYLPDAGATELSSLAERLEQASADLCREGTPVRYLDSTFMPEEESCFCRFEAPSLHATALVNRLAHAPYARICAAVTFPTREERFACRS
jgi:Nickel responsive protein SCO4226-like